MREWTELYRDMLSAYNALAEAIATAKTLHERDTRRIAELEAELAAERDELLARAEAAEEDGAAYELRRLAGLAGLPVSADSAHEVTEELAAAVATLRAQLTELEAQLAALKAGEWRPVSEAPEEGRTLVLMRSYNKRHGYEYKRAIWESNYRNECENTIEHRLEGYWFSVEDDEDEIDIEEWDQWLLLPLRPAPPTSGPRTAR